MIDFHLKCWPNSRNTELREAFCYFEITARWTVTTFYMGRERIFGITIFNLEGTLIEPPSLIRD